MPDRIVGYHRELDFPKNREDQKTEIPREVETKIIEGFNREELIKKIQKEGGVPEGENILIQDRTFRVDKTAGIQESSFPMRVPLRDMQDQNDRASLRQALRLLGLKITEFVHESEGDAYVVALKSRIKSRPVRFRRIGDGELYFTVKERRKKNPEDNIDNRIEIEVPISRTQPLESLLGALGYREDQSLDKRVTRTSYKVGDTKVEFNSAPHLGIPDWVEIEGHNPDAIKKTAELLGIPQASFRSMSLKSQMEYFKSGTEPTPLAQE